MVKYKPGTGARYGRLVFNPRWGLEYTRFPYVTRKSAKVKAINVCLKAAKKGVTGITVTIDGRNFGFAPPAQIAKQLNPDAWARGGSEAKTLLSKAMKAVLTACKDNADKICEAAAADMGLDKDTCVEMLGAIKV